MSNNTLFASIPNAPIDPILGVSEKFMSDTSPHKVNLGVGVYQNSDGKSLKPASVRKAEELIYAGDTAAGYGPIEGNKEFIDHTQALLFGADSEAIKSGRVVTIQSPGGTGGVRLGAELLRFFFKGREIWISNPTWDNHWSIFEAAGVPTQKYPYYNATERALDYSGCISALRGAKEGSIVLLHVCCHNPTGYDFSKEQWQEIKTLVQEKQLVPFFDFAYQGLSEGIVEDAYPVKLFTESGISFLMANSFSKSFGLYADRIGALSVVTHSKKEADAVRSQLKSIVRTIYTNPPARGAKIVNTVFGTPDLRAQWESELGSMRNRMKEMRSAFVSQLAATGVDQDFSHVLKQNGMFSFSGISRDVVLWIREHKSVYTLESGRICVAALNQKNIEYVCDAIASGIKAVRA